MNRSRLNQARVVSYNGPPLTPEKKYSLDLIKYSMQISSAAIHGLCRLLPFLSKSCKLAFLVKYPIQYYSTVLFIFLSPPRFLLEIRVIIKISKKFLVSHKLWLIWIRMKQKKIFFLKKKNSKWPTQKNWVFQLPPKAEQLSPKFHRLVLGLVGLIDAKGINVTQPIWLSGCPT